MVAHRKSLIYSLCWHVINRWLPCVRSHPMEKSIRIKRENEVEDKSDLWERTVTFWEAGLHTLFNLFSTWSLGMQQQSDISLCSTDQAGDVVHLPVSYSHRNRTNSAAWQIWLRGMAYLFIMTQSLLGTRTVFRNWNIRSGNWASILYFWHFSFESHSLRDKELS